MTVFRRSLLTLGLAALGLSTALILLVLVFMNSLYYGINARLLRDTAASFLSAAGEDVLRDFFSGAAGSGAAGSDAAAGGNGLPPVLPALLRNGAYRLTLVGRGGDVLWDSGFEREQVNHSDREEIRAALEGREGRAWRDSASTGMRQIYAALPVLREGAVCGVFRLSCRVPSFWQRVAPAALPFLLFAGVSSLALLAAVYAFSRSLSLSFSRLLYFARNADGEREPGSDRYLPGGSAGNFDAQEFLTLEKALRGMKAELEGRIAQARSEGRRLEAILDGISEAVFAAGTDLSLLLVNPRARELFGLGGGDLRGLSLLEATCSTELEETARRALAEGRSLDRELRLHRAGQEQRFQVFAAPLPSHAGDGDDRDAVSGGGFPRKPGRMEGIVMVLADITRIARLEQVRKDFVANVSHELRTPIQLMKGFSETLLDTPLEDRDQIRRSMEIIQKNANTMENLVNDLLALASLEDGGVNRPELEEQPVAPLFAEAASAVESRAKAKGTAVTVDCPPDLRARLQGAFVVQALINLLDNAVKYSPDGSSVQASAFVEDGGLVLQVRDEGIGIPPAHLERIFERFYRVDRARSREAGGTGLGLSIVRHIALLHGGAVEVESQAGEGAVFRVRIPLNG